MAIHTLDEIEQVFECTTCISGGHDIVNCALPGAFDGTQPVANRAGINWLETVGAGINIRREYGDAVGLGVVKNNLHLVGEIHHTRHIRRHKFGGVMRFQISGLIRQQRVRCRMGFIEPVTGKLFHEVEKLFRDTFFNAILDCAFGKNSAVLGHLVGLLFTHRAAQQISAAK